MAKDTKVKKKKNNEILDTKEEAAIAKAIPIGMIVGVSIGIILSFVFDNDWMVMYGIMAGLLWATCFAPLSTIEKVEIKTKSGKKTSKKKTTKKK